MSSPVDWVDVNISLPDPHYEVLFIENGEADFGFCYDPINKLWVSSNYCTVHENVTHWLDYVLELEYCNRKLKE